MSTITFISDEFLYMAFVAGVPILLLAAGHLVRNRLAEIRWYFLRTK